MSEETESAIDRLVPARAVACCSKCGNRLVIQQDGVGTGSDLSCTILGTKYAACPIHGRVIIDDLMK
jgi:hypothetical protein